MLRANAIPKRFGRTLALDAVDFEAFPGEIHPRKRPYGGLLNHALLSCIGSAYARFRSPARRYPLTSQDGSTEITLQVRGGSPLEFTAITGVVIDARQIAQSETHVSGGGGGTQYDGTTVVTASPISITTRHWTTDTIFLKYGDSEWSFKVIDNPMPVRTGNRLTAIYGRRPGDKMGGVVGLYNHDTKSGYAVGMVDPRYKPITLLLFWGTPLALTIRASLLIPHNPPDSGDLLVIRFILNMMVYGGITLIAYAAYRSWRRKGVTKTVHKILRCVADGKDIKTLETA